MWSLTPLTACGAAPGASSSTRTTSSTSRTTRGGGSPRPAPTSSSTCPQGKTPDCTFPRMPMISFIRASPRTPMVLLISNASTVRSGTTFLGSPIIRDHSLSSPSGSSPKFMVFLERPCSRFRSPLSPELLSPFCILYSSSSSARRPRR